MLAKPEEKEEMEATASEPDQNSFMTAKISVVQTRDMRSMSLPAPNFDVSAFASSHEEQPLSNKASHFLIEINVRKSILQVFNEKESTFNDYSTLLRKLSMKQTSTLRLAVS